MATQAMLIADTIAGMKRATARNSRSSPISDSDDSISRFTNRGNKLKRKARYVHEGQLDRPNGPKVYKRSIEHAGFHRDIISQIPKRYDINGDELEDDEEDEDADAIAAEANPYSGVALHELLAPLTSAADLPNHPSLSVPYASSIIGNMTQQACEMLQRERDIIRGAKQVLTKLRGDDTWIPCGSLDSDLDDTIFDTARVYETIIRISASPKSMKKDYKRPVIHKSLAPLGDETAENVIASQTLKRYVESHPVTAKSSRQIDDQHEAGESVRPTLATPNATGLGITQGDEQLADLAGSESNVEAVDQELDNVPAEKDGTSAEPPRGKRKDPSEIVTNKDSNKDSANGHSETRPNQEGSLETEVIAVTDFIKEEAHVQQQQEAADKAAAVVEVARAKNASDEATPATLGNDVMDAEEGRPSNEDIQPNGHRMRTRAQAQAVSDNVASYQTPSASDVSSELATVHPLFLTPQGAYPDRDFGLPAEEAEATRRILMSYVQKQEEVCRGAEKLYDGFLRVERMKQHVDESCKHEAHIGEMSDGEDWYDKEKWGLTEDLRKGRDEDQEEEGGTQHKKTRGRRA
ncbi:MAG: hypothetical protein Q9174_000243 [Haloplaca sp. 1 TL-2023]